MKEYAARQNQTHPPVRRANSKNSNPCWVRPLNCHARFQQSANRTSSTQISPRPLPQWGYGSEYAPNQVSSQKPPCNGQSQIKVVLEKHDEVQKSVAGERRL